MAEKIHVTPGEVTKTSAKAGIVVAALFLLFGLAFGYVSLSDVSDDEVGLSILIGVFFLIWIVACVSMIVLYSKLLSKPTVSGGNSLVDLDFASSGDARAGGGCDFDTRLRKLEQLKQDELITEAEYLGKREQILKENW